ncbi:MAG: aldehyde dehydrogenase family protein, partial [Candidatus Nitrosocosmicus sp.]
MTIKTINPSTEEVIQEYENITKEELVDKTKKSKEAFEEWKKDPHKRADYIYAFASELRKNKDDLAKTATMEMGKAIKESKAEVEKCAWAMEYFADNAKIFLTDDIINTEARKSNVVFEPIGVIASLMPWNFPYWQALRFAAPSLMAGNTIVLKPSSVTMQCGIEMEKTFTKIGLPDNVFQTIIAS